MVSPNKACHWVSVGTCVLACLLAQAEASRAGDFRLESVGARGGIYGNSGPHDFHQAEAFAIWNLPWDWDLGKEWHLQSQLELSAGWLGDSGVNSAIGSLGPGVLLSRARLPVSLEAGFYPTLLSKHTFGSEKIGSDFQINNHVGLNWDFAEHWRLSYRFEHLSNAGLSKDNPGLNMHLFGLSYVF